MQTWSGRLGGGVFRDREDAGRALAAAVARLEGLVDPLVLALPRGGVPVGAEVAHALGAELDVWIVRKLGMPGHAELAIGAIASGGVRVLNPEVLQQAHLPPGLIDEIARREGQELERRERAYRGGAPAPSLVGRSVLLVDDGLATGSTMSAAVHAVRQLHPHEVIVAVPVAPPDTLARLAEEADRVVCVAAPDPFLAIGLHYASFPQLEDAEVLELLRRAARERGEGR